jgi:predicted transcriptional regulator
LLTKLASHPLKPDEIAGFYRAEAMIARRFEQLEGSDLITTSPAGFKLTTRGKRVVRSFSLLQAVLGRSNRWVARMSCEGDDAS